MEILFGFEQSAFTDKLLKLLANRGVTASGTYRASKIAVKEYLRQNKDCNTVVLREFSAIAQYESSDLVEIADIRDELNIVVVLDSIHRGTSYMQDLLSAGIRNAIFQQRKGVSSAEIVELVLNKRSREEAWKYYGLTTLGAMSQTITQQKYNDCIITLEDTTFGKHLGERYKAVVADMTPLQNADFLQKLRVYHKVLFGELTMYKEYYDVVEFLTEEGIKLPFKVKRPRKLFAPKEPVKTEMIEEAAELVVSEEETTEDEAHEIQDVGSEDESADYRFDGSLDELFGDINLSEDDVAIEEESGQQQIEGEDLELADDEEEDNVEDASEEDIFLADPLLAEYESLTDEEVEEVKEEETAPVMKKNIFSKKAEKAGTEDFDRMESFYEDDEEEEGGKKSFPLAVIVTVSVILFILIIVFFFFIKNTLENIDRQARERQKSISSNSYIKEDSYLDDDDSDSMVAVVEGESEEEEPLASKTPKKIAVTKVTKEELSAQMESAEDVIDAQIQENEDEDEDEEDEDDIPTYVLDDEDEDDTSDDSGSNSSGNETSGNNSSGGNNNSSYYGNGNSNYSNDSGSDTSQDGNSSYYPPYYPPSQDTGNSSNTNTDTQKEEPDYTQIDDSISFNYEPDEKESSFDGETISNGDVLTGVEVINYINSRKSGTFYIVYEQEKIKIKAKKATAANVPSQLDYEVSIKNGKTSFIPRLY